MFRALGPSTKPAALAIAATLLGAACAPDEQTSTPPEPPPASEARPPRDAPDIRNLDEIVAAGELRVIVRRAPHEDGLPRRPSPAHHERELARTLAEQLGVEAELILVDERSGLLTALLNGRGDVVVGNVTVTEERAESVSFSAPVTTTREIVVARAEDAIESPDDLTGRTLAVQRSAAFWETANSLAARIEGLSIAPVDETLDSHDIIDGVATGRFDLTIADENFLEATLSWRDDVHGAFPVGSTRLIAWAVRPGAESLRSAIDLFLLRARLASAQSATPDLPGIRERNTLRVLTRNNAATYYIWRGDLFGFEYELTRRLAEELGVRADMVVPPSRDALLDWLRSGRGDLVAANLTASEERRSEEGIVFSEPYFYVTEAVVSRAEEAPLESVEDLAGRRIAVRPSSSYWRTLEALRDGGVALELAAADETMETERIIDAVARGELDLTVADSHIVALESTWRDDIRADLELGEPRPLAWAMREDDTELQAAVNEFIRSHYRGLFYNIVVEKYFESERSARPQAAQTARRTGRISPYDELAMTYASRYGFDWRLIVSQMYQESRFDPEARSFAEAAGLMQVLPSTAAELGFEPAAITEPEIGLHAGVRYLDWTRERFDTLVPPEELNWFALAAYNVGQGHVRDARQLARSEGLDPNRWFDNVEQAMLLKEQRAHYSKTRFGYARGREPVNYVRAVRRRYEAYLQLPLE